MTAPFMVRVAFAFAGMEAVGVECHLGGEVFRKSSAWPSHLFLSCTSNGARKFGVFESGAVVDPYDDVPITRVSD